MEHSFDIEAAQKYGVNAAIVLRHLQYWIIKNKTHNKNFHDGRFWTYYSVSGYTKVLPYLTQKQVRRALQILIDQKVILKGDYNKFRNTKTSWYSFIDESSFAPEGKPDKSSFAPEGRPFAPEGKLFKDKDKQIKKTDEETDKSKIFQKADLSSKEAGQQAAVTLLICRGVDEIVARSIVYEQQTPLSSIEEAVKNGLAKENHAKETGGTFVLEAGYIIKALNKARREGKIVGPTKLSKELKKKIHNQNQKYEPMNETEFEKCKRRQLAALITKT